MLQNKLFFTVFLLLIFGLIQAQDLNSIKQNSVKLPNGWSLTPLGKSIPLGDLPLNIAVSKKHRYAAVTNNGQSIQTIQLLDAKNDVELDKVIISKSWGGVVFSADEKYLYASGGDDNWIIRYSIINNKLIVSDTIKLGAAWSKQKNASSISPTGIALDDKRGLLYAVTKQDNSLYIIDLKTKTIQHKVELGSEAYTCLLSPDQSKLYISLWGKDKVMIYDTKNNKPADLISVGDNPNDLCISHNGRWLYVSNANDNTVSVININKAKVLETLNTAVFPTQLSGTTSNAVALSDDDKTLYVANADNNCLAVFDVNNPGSSHSLGFIPTGWYPSVVRVIDGKLYVANAKGFSSLPNPYGPNPTVPKEKVLLHGFDQGKSQQVQYIGGGLLMGTLSIIPIPSEKELSLYSQAVYHNTPYRKEQELNAEGEEDNPIPRKAGESSPIKYVFYILQENRTYDQVLSDMPQGNGDTSLLLFGRHVTPNHHSLVDHFVLLDNFYVDGEVSADGHNWSLGGYATDYLEKTWPTSYGGRGGDYDAEGNRKISNNKDGFIWDFCNRYGVSYRTYGEFADDYKPNIPVLKGHFCPYYTSWDQKVRDTIRFTQWRRDFDSLLVHQCLPRLNTLRFINDHTEGLNKGRPTPKAHVADNDLAVGMFVDYLSHSSIWNESAVFIVEDDAQNGPDHVDAHRSTAFVAGGFVKEGFVDHTMYSTASMLHTMELILGIPPMSQYDASAEPMWRCFDTVAKHKPYSVKPHQVDLNEVNTNASKYADLSQQLDFSKEDEAPDGLFNEIIWKAVKGVDSACPASVHAAFLINR